MRNFIEFMVAGVGGTILALVIVREVVETLKFGELMIILRMLG